MTFRISANVFPSVSNLPSLGNPFSDLLTDGSLCLLDKENMARAVGLTPTTNIGNMAEAFAKKQTGNPVNAFLNNTMASNFPTETTDFSKYFKSSLTARGGLYIDPVLGQNSDKPIGLAIRLLPAGASTDIFSTPKSVYLDAWFRTVRLPVANTTAGIANSWKAISTQGVGYNALTQTSTTVVSPLVYDLTNASIPAKAVPALGAGQLLSAKYLSSGLRLGESQMAASAGPVAVVASGSSLPYTSIPFGILEGNYDGRAFILYGAYMEDLTTSGRTADQVAAIRKKEFDAAFSVGGRFYGDSL